MSKNKTYIYILLMTLLCLLNSCHNRNLIYYKKLQQVDSLLNQNNLDSAKQLFYNLKGISLQNKYNQAYYKLLYTRLNYMLYNPKLSTEQLDECISYYKQEKCKDKLAESYFYKGIILYDLGQQQKAILYIKRSEKIATSIKDYNLEYKIYTALARINSIAGNFNLAMEYALKNLEFCKKENNYSTQIDIYNSIAIAYHDLYRDDSARIYINKCIPLLKFITSPKAKIIILDNIGYFNMNSDPALAIKYLNMAMAIEPSVDTYDNLARIFAKQGHTIKADSLWTKALTTKDLPKKAEILSAMLKQKQKEGDTHNVYQLSIKLLNLKDSIKQQKQNEEIKDLQIKFDNNTKQEKNNKTLLIQICIIFILSLLLIIGWGYSKKQHIRTKKKLLEQEDALLYSKQLTEYYKQENQKLEKSGNTDKTLIKRLKNKNEKFQRLLENDEIQRHLLYETAKKGLSIKDWNKPEISKFLDYYISIDMKFSLLLEENELTPRQKLFLILIHEGFSENKVAEMMGLNYGALRTMKCRIPNINKYIDKNE